MSRVGPSQYPSRLSLHFFVRGNLKQGVYLNDLPHNRGVLKEGIQKQQMNPVSSTLFEKYRKCKIWNFVTKFCIRVLFWIRDRFVLYLLCVE